MPWGKNDSPTLRLSRREMPVTVRRHARARRMSLRLEPRGEAVSLVLPSGVSLREGLRFAQRQETWIEAQLAALPSRIPFIDGANVPILGVPHVIRHCPTATRGVWRAQQHIFVSGRSEHVARRTRDFLIATARREIAGRAREKAAFFDGKVASITLRDTRSRWGSCSIAGGLAFSWRLILAPEAVLDYVIAHEIAHLEEMNHSPRFWALAGRLSQDIESSRRWLKENGPGLLRYG